MSNNPFADALKGPERQPITHHVEPAKPFFHAAIEQDKLRQKAANMTRQEMFNNGFITVADMDDEELRYGKCRDRNGRIPKSPNKTEMVPRDLYDEMVLEHQKRTDEKLRQQLDTMLEVMIQVATDDTVEPRDRVDAAKYLFERVAGKTPDKVQVQVSQAPWEDMLSGVARITRAQSLALRAGETIDAEVVPDDPTADDPTGQSDSPDSPTQQSGGTGGGSPGGATGSMASYAAEYAYPASQFTPAPEAPTHDNPATNSPIPSAIPNVAPTLSDQIRQAQEQAADLAERRKRARAKIQAAKKRRKVARALGKDGAPQVDISQAQDRLAQTHSWPPDVNHVNPPPVPDTR